jgi:hypothetical protein
MKLVLVITTVMFFGCEGTEMLEEAVQDASSAPVFVLETGVRGTDAGYPDAKATIDAASVHFGRDAGVLDARVMDARAQDSAQGQDVYQAPTWQKVETKMAAVRIGRCLTTTELHGRDCDSSEAWRNLTQKLNLVRGSPPSGFDIEAVDEVEGLWQGVFVRIDGFEIVWTGGLACADSQEVMMLVDVYQCR